MPRTGRAACGVRAVGVQAFDVHVVVDWSASASPTRGRDSIWSAVRRVGGDHVELANHPTRAAALAHLDALVGSSPGERIFIGVDFPLGAPVALVPAADGEVGAARARDRWRDTWSAIVELLDDDDRNRNNRFAVGAELNRRFGTGEGPFWGCPRRHESRWLRATKPARFAVPEWRRVEAVLRRAGRRPFSFWQLAYAGSVGGQALTGIPVVARLAAAHPTRVRVWPFETGLEGDPTAGRGDAVVVAEVWPSAFDVDRRLHPVRDAAQVLHASAATRDADRLGRFGSWFEPGLECSAVRDAVIGHEGWVVGVGGDGSLAWQR